MSTTKRRNFICTPNMTMNKSKQFLCMIFTCNKLSPYLFSTQTNVTRSFIFIPVDVKIFRKQRLDSKGALNVNAINFESLPHWLKPLMVRSRWNIRPSPQSTHFNWLFMIRSCITHKSSSNITIHFNSLVNYVAKLNYKRNLVHRGLYSNLFGNSNSYSLKDSPPC